MPPSVERGLILSAEDDPDDRRFLKRALRQAVTNPIVFTKDGAEVLDYLYGRGDRAERYVDPVLLFLDLEMPRRDGREVLADLRSSRRFEQLPVVVLTASKNAGQIEQLYRGGANSVVTKEASYREFASSIQTLANYWLRFVRLPTGSHGPFPGSSSSESEVIDAALGGDRAAIEKLIKSHKARVYRFAVRMTNDPQQAEEIAQETMLTMLTSLGEFRGESSLSTWLYKLTRTHWSRQSRVGSDPSLYDGVVELETEASDEPSPEEQVASAQQRQRVNDATFSLGQEAREVVVLRDLEQLSAAEVAEILEISVSAVKSRLHRARQAIRHNLKAAS